LKNARERMDILAAYREVGSYRGAAQICGTTHKTVKRPVERHNPGGGMPVRNAPATRQLASEGPGAV